MGCLFYLNIIRILRMKLPTGMKEDRKIRHLQNAEMQNSFQTKADKDDPMGFGLDHDEEEEYVK